MQRSISLLLLTAFVAGCSGPSQPTAGPVTYVDKDGQSVTVQAWPGQVLVLAAGPSVPASAVEALAAANGGSMLFEVPQGGVYAVGVTPGSEARFIAATRSSTAVLDALPDLYLEPQGASLGVVDFFTGQASQADCPDLSHGAAVSKLLGAQPGAQFPIDVDKGNGSKGAAADAAAIAIASGVLNLSAASGPVVINSSVGAPDLPTEDKLLHSLATQLESPSIDLSRTVVVLAAGNYGQDLSGILQKLYLIHPKMIGHLIVVGSARNCVPIRTDGSGSNPNRNISSVTTGDAGNPLMLYAPGEQVPIPNSDCHPLSGTSFAAPQVAKDIQSALNANMTLTVDMVMQQYFARVKMNRNMVGVDCPCAPGTPGCACVPGVKGCPCLQNGSVAPSNVGVAAACCGHQGGGIGKTTYCCSQVMLGNSAPCSSPADCCGSYDPSLHETCMGGHCCEMTGDRCNCIVDACGVTGLCCGCCVNNGACCAPTQAPDSACCSGTCNAGTCG